MDVSQCQLLQEKAGEGKAAKAARLLFGPPAAPARGKGLGPDQCRGAFGSCSNIVLIASKGLSKRVQQSQVALTDNHTETRDASLEREKALPLNRSVNFKLASLGSNSSLQSRQLLSARGSLVGKFKCLAVI